GAVGGGGARKRVAPGLLFVPDGDGHALNGGHSRRRGRARLPSRVTPQWLPGPPPPRHRAGRRAPATTTGQKTAGGPPDQGDPPAGGCWRERGAWYGRRRRRCGAAWGGEGSTASRRHPSSLSILRGSLDAG